MKFIIHIGGKILLFLSRRVFTFLFSVLALYITGYFVVTQLNWQQYIDPSEIPAEAYTLAQQLDFHNWSYSGPTFSLPSIFQGAQATFAINDDTNSNIGAVVSYPEGGGMVVYMKNSGQKRILDRIIGQNKDGTESSLLFNDNGLPSLFTADGYTIAYTEFRENSFDILVTHPDETTEAHTEIPLTFLKETASLNFIQTAHALGVDTVIKFLGTYVAKSATASGVTVADNIGSSALNYADVRDHSYWTQTVNIAVNLGLCAGGVVTMLAPNPLSVSAIALGCGSTLLDSVPVVTNLDPCNTKDVYAKGCFGELIDQVRGIDNSTPISRIVLTGQVRSDQSGPVSGAKLVFVHKNGEVVTVRPSANGTFGSTLSSKGAALKTGAYTLTVSAPDLTTMHMKGVVSTKRVTFTHNGKTVFSKKINLNGLRWNINMQSPETDTEADPVDTPIIQTDSATAVRYVGTISTGSQNNLQNFPMLTAFSGTLEVIIQPDDSLQCTLTMNGTSKYSNVTGSISGPLSIQSTQCEGGLTPSTNQIGATGVHKGTEPPFISSDGSIDSTGRGKLGGSYTNVMFTLNGKMTGSSITGGLYTTRGIWVNQAGLPISFTLKKM